MQFKTLWAAPALAALLAACQADSPSEERPVGTSVSEEYKSPADVHFLHDAEGNVLKKLPPEVLSTMRAELLAQGKTATARNIEARYDFISGEVKDPLAADRAEQFLKSQVSKQSLVPAPETNPEGVKVLNPDELPAGIQITEDMVAGLRKAAAEAGAK